MAGRTAFCGSSEWGVIQASDLARSEEILTGALPSVGDGMCVVETTWRGGRNGHLWSLVKSALETPEEQKGPLDWRVVFFPWQHDPSTGTRSRARLARRPRGISLGCPPRRVIFHLAK